LGGIRVLTDQKPQPFSISKQMPIRLNIGTIVDIIGKKYSMVDVEINGIKFTFEGQCKRNRLYTHTLEELR
jgi:hypothetical protein